MTGWQLTTPYACGLITEENGTVVQPVAPIYRKLVGQWLQTILLAKGYRVQRLPE